MCRQLLQERYAGLAKGFGVRHQMHVADFHAVLRIEELAHLHQLLHRKAAGFAMLTGQHGLFQISQTHKVLSELRRSDPRRMELR